jgi:hypothetical protein
LAARVKDTAEHLLAYRKRGSATHREHLCTETNAGNRIYRTQEGAAAANAYNLCLKPVAVSDDFTTLTYGTRRPICLDQLPFCFSNTSAPPP